jgi:hypothetical protein
LLFLTSSTPLNLFAAAKGLNTKPHPKSFSYKEKDFNTNFVLPSPLGEGRVRYSFSLYQKNRKKIKERFLIPLPGFKTKRVIFR